MEQATLQASIDALALSLGELLEDHQDFAIRPLPLDPLDQLRWMRTLQQFGSDVEALADAACVLIRTGEEMRRRFRHSGADVD